MPFVCHLIYKKSLKIKKNITLSAWKNNFEKKCQCEKLVVQILKNTVGKKS